MLIWLSLSRNSFFAVSSILGWMLLLFIYLFIFIKHETSVSQFFRAVSQLYLMISCLGIEPYPDGILSSVIKCVLCFDFDFWIFKIFVFISGFARFMFWFSFLDHQIPPSFMNPYEDFLNPQCQRNPPKKCSYESWKWGYNISFYEFKDIDTSILSITWHFIWRINNPYSHLGSIWIMEFLKQKLSCREL